MGCSDEKEPPLELANGIRNRRIKGKQSDHRELETIGSFNFHQQDYLTEAITTTKKLELYAIPRQIQGKSEDLIPKRT